MVVSVTMDIIVCTSFVVATVGTKAAKMVYAGRVDDDKPSATNNFVVVTGNLVNRV